MLQHKQLPCKKEEVAAYVCEGSKVDLVLRAESPPWPNEPQTQSYSENYYGNLNQNCK